MMRNKILVVLLLKLIGSGLPHIIRGYTDIYCDALINVVVVVVDLLFCRNIAVLVGIHFDLHPAADFLFLLYATSAFFIINH